MVTEIPQYNPDLSLQEQLHRVDFRCRRTESEEIRPGCEISRVENSIYSIFKLGNHEIRIKESVIYSFRYSSMESKERAIEINFLENDPLEVYSRTEYPHKARARLERQAIIDRIVSIRDPDSDDESASADDQSNYNEKGCFCRNLGEHHYDSWEKADCSMRRVSRRLRIDPYYFFPDHPIPS